MIVNGRVQRKLAGYKDIPLPYCGKIHSEKQTNFRKRRKLYCISLITFNPLHQNTMRLNLKL